MIPCHDGMLAGFALGTIFGIIIFGASLAYLVHWFQKRNESPYKRRRMEEAEGQ